MSRGSFRTASATRCTSASSVAGGSESPACGSESTRPPVRRVPGAWPESRLTGRARRQGQRMRLKDQIRTYLSGYTGQRSSRRLPASLCLRALGLPPPTSARDHPDELRLERPPRGSGGKSPGNSPLRRSNERSPRSTRSPTECRRRPSGGSADARQTRSILLGVEVRPAGRACNCRRNNT